MLLITHTDCDGLGCAVLAKAVFPDILIEYVGYDFDRDKLYTEGLSLSGVPIFMTDMSPNVETAKEINRKVQEGSLKFTLIDHHQTALEKLNGYSYAHVDTSMSATKLFYNYLSETTKINLFSYQSFVEATNEYDLFLFDIKKLDLKGHVIWDSMALNYLHAVMPKSLYVDRFLKNPQLDFSYNERKIIQSKHSETISDIIELRESAGELHETNLGNKFLFIEFQKNKNPSISIPSAYLLQTEWLKADFVVYQYANGVISFRSRGYDCTPIAKHFGGGGHPQACGGKRDKGTDIIGIIQSLS